MRDTDARIPIGLSAGFARALFTSVFDRNGPAGFLSGTDYEAYALPIGIGGDPPRSGEEVP